LRREPRDGIAVGATEAPRRDHERGDDGDRHEREDGDSRLAVLPAAPGGGTRRARTTTSSSPTAKRELYSSTNGWPSRPSAFA
jgi:hypothetical protein